MTTATVRSETKPQRPSSKRTAASEREAKPQVTADAAERPARTYPAGHALLAAERAVHRDMVHVSLPLVGELHLPPAEELVFLGGTAFLAVVGVVEWPVAVFLGVGHALALNGRNKVVRALGETLEEV